MNKSGETIELCSDWNSSNSAMITYSRFDTILNGYCTLVTVAVGILGNSYSIYLLRRRFNVRATISMYLRVLAVWDVLLLAGTFWYYSLYATLPYQLPKSVTDFFSYSTITFHSFIQISMTSSIWMSVVITSERHWAILFPHKHRAIDTTQRARFICILVGVASVIFNLPTFFELRIVECRTVTGVVSYADGTSLRKQTIYRIYYRAISTLMFTTLVPVASIFLLTVRMIVAVREQHATKTLATAGHKYRKELYTTVMLLALAGKFLICHAFPVVMNIIELKLFAGRNSKTNGLYEQPTFYQYIIDISNYLVVLNSATNWLVYFCWRKHFVAQISFLSRSRRKLRKRRTRTKNDRENDSNFLAESQRLYAAPPLAAMRKRESYFTPQEAEVLQRIWTESLQFSDPPIGQKILVEIVRKNPELTEHFGLNISDKYQQEVLLANLHTVPKIQANGATITEFLEVVIFGAGDLRSEMRLTYYIRHVGQHHSSKGIYFSNEIWRELKNALLDQTEHLNYCIFGNLQKFTLTAMGLSSVKIKLAWAKMVNFILREMRQGSFMYVLRVQNPNGDPSASGCLNNKSVM